MSYLLDTTVISDFVRGDARVKARLLATPANRVAVSTLTIMEVEYGVALVPSRAKRLRPVIEALLDSVVHVPFGDAEARAAATLRAALRKRGRPIGAYDVLIAGTALANGRILVTSNTRELVRVLGLSVEDWRR